MLPTLHLGNKNYSSWSLRPWLALRWGGIPFTEHVIQLGGEGYGRSAIPAVRAVSPSGRVPALTVGGETIWDSLSICEWAAEQKPSLWPADAPTRAVARSVTAEMHSGFAALRRDMSMNIRRRRPEPDWPEDTRADLVRLAELFGVLGARSPGPWMFGERSIADAFYAPVATRLRTYSVPLSGPLAAWSATLLADADFREWEAAAQAEPWTVEQTEKLWP